ncbi:MAG TPA: V-type ATP synthase subunit B [Anaeromyxobacteraceae bacterium]|nr:V-type ATP synthase subunit B [Anaeromyxobacteraceae bacterium]
MALDLLTRKVLGAQAIAGPLLFLEGVPRARLGEMVRIRVPSADGAGGERYRGQIIEISRTRVAVQILEETRGLAPARAEVELTGEVASLGVSRALLGRVLDGLGQPADGLPPPVPEARLPIHGAALNVTRRAKPSDFIETGISAIDGMNTLVRGQKLPIFSCAGLPAGRLAAQIVCQARVRGGERFAVVFAAMGAPFREYDAYLEAFRAAGVLDRTAVFLNKADDPPIERLMTPRCALTAAEHLAFVHGMQVLVVLTDVTAYCEALREVALAREEVPGRRGYPGYMYTDLATLYERAGRIAGRPGSVTQVPVLTMPDDDLTHPIPDLSGYITEGQIVLSRDLDRRGVYPPIDVLPSLSRLMGLGTGKGKTREDHRPVADQLYAFYARGRDVRRMAAIVGAANLGEEEKKLLEFADRFEAELVGQGSAFRSVEETLDRGWALLAAFPPAALTRIPSEILEGRSHGPIADDADGAARAAGAEGGGGQGGPPAAGQA